MRATAIYGPPGTGKTIHLAKLVNRLAVTIPNMGVCSFSKAAAGVLTSRLSHHSIRYVGTLHALAFRTLGLTRQSVADEAVFAKWYGTDTEEVQMALSVHRYAHHRKVDLAVAFVVLNPILPFMRVEHLVGSYLNWKNTYQYIDFDDMIVAATGKAEPFDVVVIDEAQDCTDEQWAFVLAMLKPDGRLYMAGDDDQCQPPNTLVLTDQGPVKMSDLNPSTHRVWSYDSNSGYGLWSKFRVVGNPYHGLLYTVYVNGEKSSYTSTHRCLARFDVSPEAIDTLRVVYLMKRGEWFRIGETKAFTKNKNGVTFYPNNRMRQERADAVWILKVCDSEIDSKQWESLFSLQFGIPTQIFDYSGLRLANIGNKGLHQFIHTKLNIRYHAFKLLFSLDMDLDHPTIVKKSGGQKTFEVMAMNLHPQLMKMAIYSGKNTPPSWHHFTIENNEYHGAVYSLDIEVKNKSYFADNIWTHNSLFTWAGANPHAMVELANDSIVLEQSWRIPVTAHRIAEATVGQINNRVQKEYHPTIEMGKVEFASYYEPVWYPDKHTVLVRDKWALKEVEDLIIERGIAYTRNGERSMFDRGRCSAAKALMLEDYATLKRLSRYLRPQFRDDLVKACAVAASGDWGWQRVLDFGTWQKEADYLSLVDPAADPVIHLSTIHGFKGEEDDHIILMANCVGQTEMAMDVQEAFENEVRVWYVGLTRCKQSMTIIGWNSFIAQRGESKWKGNQQISQMEALQNELRHEELVQLADGII